MDRASSLLGNHNDSPADGSRPSGPAENVADRSQTKKTAGSKRRKTFTGCWTCRERHVKCDEQRPRCKRCVVGNFTCQGYGTRLTWLTPGSQRASRGSDYKARSMQKRRRHADQRSRAAFNTIQVCQDTQQVESAGVNAFHPSQVIGSTCDPAMFGGFPHDTGASTNSKHAAESKQMAQDVSLWPIVDNSRWSLGMEYIQFDWSSPVQKMQNSGIDIFDPLYGLSIPQIGSPMKPFEVPTAPARERELMSHWSTNLADKLVPFRSPVNPFLTIVCPMALEGSRIARTESTCTVALLHAVCAISAAHRANLRGCPSDDGLVEHHKQLSFQHLMQNMYRTDLEERMACLATLCLWILIHFVTGTPGAWRDVAKITRDLLERVNSETWGQSTTAALTYQSFSTSFALIQAQYLGRQEPLAPLKPNLPGVDMDQTVPSRSLELLSSFNAKLMRGPIVASEELDQLEIEFALSTPEPSTQFDAGNVSSALVEIHRSLFYYASMLYFRGNSGRRGPEHEIQSLVAKCLAHMEEIDQLQKDGNPKTWIYAVVAFEAATAELRQRAKVLFNKRMSLGIATWDTLLRAVVEIWRRRDATPPGFQPEPWTRILSEMPDLDVVLY